MTLLEQELQRALAAEIIEISAICLLVICFAGLFWFLAEASNDSDIDGDSN